MLKNNNIFTVGDVISADFGPIPDKRKPDHEQAGRRPALVLSVGDEIEGNYLLTVIPITNSSQDNYPFAIDLSNYNVKKTTGTVLVNQLRTIDKNAHGEIKCFDHITDEQLLTDIHKCLKIWLALN